MHAWDFLDVTTVHMRFRFLKDTQVVIKNQRLHHDYSERNFS